MFMWTGTQSFECTLTATGYGHNCSLLLERKKEMTLTLGENLLLPGNYRETGMHDVTHIQCANWTRFGGSVTSAEKLSSAAKTEADRTTKVNVGSLKSDEAALADVEKRRNRMARFGVVLEE